MQYCNHLAEEERAGCFAVILFSLLCVGLCSSVSLPCGTMGWSVIVGVSLNRFR